MTKDPCVWEALLLLLGKDGGSAAALLILGFYPEPKEAE